jgi:hypothetical protein
LPETLLFRFLCSQHTAVSPQRIPLTSRKPFFLLHRPLPQFADEQALETEKEIGFYVKELEGKKAGVDESRAESSHLVRQLCCSLIKMKMTNGVQTRFTCLPPLCFRPPGLLCSQPAGLTNPSDACLNTIKTETTKILQSSSV